MAFSAARCTVKPRRALGAAGWLCLLAAAAPAGAQLPDWDFTKGSDLGWTPNPALGPGSATAAGLTTSLVSPDPNLTGPAVAFEAAQARYVFVRMKVAHHGGGSVYFTTAAEPQFKQANMLPFRVTPGGDWQELWLETKEAPGWQGTITRLRLDPIDVWPNIPAAQEIVIARVALLPAEAKAAEMELVHFHVGTTWRVKPGETVAVSAKLANRGGRPAKLGPIALDVPGSCAITDAPKTPPDLPAGAELTLAWRLRATKPGAGAVSLFVPVVGAKPLVGARRLFVHGPWTDAGEVILVPAGKVHGHVRTVATRTQAGQYGTLLFQAMTDDGAGWRALATIPSLGTVIASGDDGRLEVVELVGAGPPTLVQMEGDPGYRLEAQARDRHGRTWFGRLTLTQPVGSPLIATRLEVRCDAPARIARLDGPTIQRAPSAPGQRRGALFGGLEWVEGAEPCWSDQLDRSPLRIRYRPHVNRIAVPAMAVGRDDGCVGWLWRPGDAPPGAVFGAPTEEVTGRGDTELGLFRPAITTLGAENQDFGMAPFEVEAGERVTLEADLLLGPPAADLSRVCRQWLNCFGLPDPLPTPRGDARSELAFTMRAFVNSLWVEAENGWQNGIGPAKNVGRYGPFLGAVLAGARLLDGDFGEACRQRLAQTEGDPDGYRGQELPWYEGSLIATFSRRIGGYLDMLKRQQPDGGWRFRDWIAQRQKGAEDKLSALGNLDRSEVGFGAANAARLLLLARLTGDPVAREAGLKALKWLDGFTIPRAAQCWEVPVQAPDIVAAADAVRALVEGYWLTGERALLAQAEVWATRGLPFIYLWNDPAIPAMRYASTPVLGATWYTGFWYGRPVQWCGLNYAEALSYLLDAGCTQPWAKLRDGLLSSGALQQFTDPKRLALIPDSIDLTQNALPADYWVAPYTQALALAHKLGVPPTPRTSVAGPYRVSAMGEVEAELVESRLEMSVAFPEQGAHHLLVAGVAAAEQVTVNGAPLPKAGALRDGAAWLLDAGRGLLEVRLTSPGKAVVVIEGLETRPVASIASRPQ